MKHSFALLSAQKKIPCLVVPSYKGDSLKRHSFIASLSDIDRAYALGSLSRFSGETLETLLLFLPSDPAIALLIVGLGEKSKWNNRTLVKASRKVISALKQARIKKAGLLCADWSVSGLTLERALEVFSSNAELADYEFNRYKEKPKDGWPSVDELIYLAPQSNAAKIKSALQTGFTIGQYTNLARDLANTPGGDMTPKILASEAKRQAEKAGARVTVLTEADMKKRGMGAILGVSKGSKEPAQLIVIEYAHPSAKKQKPLVYIGKGITFDSGGLHLKPSSSMDEMHMDMSGGAAVVGAVCAISKLALKTRVIGIVPAVENMPSGESFRPGDVLVSLSGKTIEVVSPDAEGRVVLADAFTFAEDFSPRMVVDLATLTGAVTVALGHHASALLTPDEAFAKHLQLVAEQSGDYLWPLPMWEEYEQDIRGAVGDILNAGKNREAGTINGGMFLYQFAKKFPKWAHIDIASTMTTSTDQVLAKGASGSGVRLLIELARQGS